MAKVISGKNDARAGGLCIEVCPTKIIVETRTELMQGYFPAEVVEMDKCIGCAFCATICPDCVITVEK